MPLPLRCAVRVVLQLLVSSAAAAGRLLGLLLALHLLLLALLLLLLLARALALGLPVGLCARVAEGDARVGQFRHPQQPHERQVLPRLQRIVRRQNRLLVRLKVIEALALDAAHRPAGTWELHC